MRSALAIILAAALAGCAGTDHAMLARPLDAIIFTAQDSGTAASLRGLCVVSADVAWASGADGTVLRTIDAGATWNTLPVAGGERLDFRDVHAFDADSAVIMSAGLPARFYATGDGGRTWTLAFERTGDGVFFDAIEFFDSRRGLAFSDPVDGRLLIVRTADGGATWDEVEPRGIPPARANEAGFAASGTGLATAGGTHAWIGLGGVEDAPARVLRTGDGGATWAAIDTPMRSGPSAGIFSLAFRDRRNGVAVGGDFLAPDVRSGTAMVTTDGGATWALADTPPRGYRSVVRFVPGLRAPVTVAAGPNGVDCSHDGGRTWRPVADDGYHCLDFAPDAPVGWAAGADGRIASVRIPRE